MSDRVRSSEPGGSTARPPANKVSPGKDQPPGKARPAAKSPTRGAAGGGRPPVGRQPMTKNEKRAAAKAARAAAEAAAAKRRRLQWLGAGIAAVVVVVVVVVGFVAFGGSKKTPSAAAQPSAPCSAAPGASDAAVAASAPAVPPSPPAGAPSLPPGTDPALATKPTVKAGDCTLTKLTVTTLVQGTGPAVKSGQSITVNYVGVSYKTGVEFDASWTQGQPFTTVIGQGQVIPGWDQGLVGVKVGSRVQLDIPSNLAYGDTSTNGSPSGPLRFVVDVLAAK